MDVRLVVTGERDGKSVFASDEMVPPITVALAPGDEFHSLWGDDTAPVLPSDGAEPSHRMFFPPDGGYRFLFFTVVPETPLPDDLDFPAAFKEMDEKLPGLAGEMDADDPGMHATDTIDMGVVLSGECVLELDDGAEVTLRPGDTYIQNGTRHRWHNRTTAPCVVAAVLIGAKRT